MSPPHSCSRRTVLSTCVAALLPAVAGCSSFDGQNKGATDVVLHNDASATETVTLTVQDGDGESPRLETTSTLEPGETVTPTASDKLPVGTDYVIEVAVEAGPQATYQWRDVQLDRAPLHVRFDSSNVSFEPESG